MAITKSAIFVPAFLAVLAAACASTVESSAASTETLDTTERYPAAKYLPSRCYRRTTVCCYKYVKCGVHCKLVRCYTIRKCVVRAPFTKKCLLYKKRTICIKRCYLKLCKRIRCSRFRVFKSRRYVSPKPYILGKRYAVKKVEKK